MTAPGADAARSSDPAARLACVPPIRAVRKAPSAVAQLGALPDDVADACLDELEGWVAQDVALGDHVVLLLVDGHALRVNLFVDTDGTLWVERVASAAGG